MARSVRVSAYLLVSILVVTLGGCVYKSPPLTIVSPLPRPHAASPLSYANMPLPLAYNIWLPLIVSGTPDLDANCFANPKALAFFRLLKADSRQQRTRLVCNPALVKAAQARALGLSTVDPWGHKDRNGAWANDYARSAGCKLPASYGAENEIESITAGAESAARAYQALVDDSADHRRHLMAEIPFFREQTQIGIGYAEGGKYGYYWAILTTPSCE